MSKLHRTWALAGVFALAALTGACGNSDSRDSVSSTDEIGTPDMAPAVEADAVASGATEEATADEVAKQAAGATRVGVGMAYGTTAPTNTDTAFSPGDGADQKPAVAPPLSRPDGKAAAIIRTGTVDVEVKDFDVAVAKVNALATQNGGYVESSNESRNGDYPTATVTIRVPADRFEDLRSGINKIGEVVSADISAQDVTGQLVDLESRLRNLRSEEAALNTLLGRASTVAEILAIQPQLFDVRGQIEQLDGQRAYLEQQAAMSTLTAIVHPAGTVIEEPKEPSWWDRVVDRVGSAWGDLGEALVYLLVVVLPVLAVLALVLWLGVRFVRRISRKQHGGSTGAPASQTAGQHDVDPGATK